MSSTTWWPTAAPASACATSRQGATAPIPGTDGGDNASWSPKGQLLAYDRLPVGDNTVYVVPPGGGTPTPVVHDAIDMDWSPDSQRLVFVRPSDGSIRTVDLAGGDETIAAPPGVEDACLPLGCSLSWSPDGRCIAYSTLSDIYTVRVCLDGHPLGPPRLVASAPGFYQTQLSWARSGVSWTLARETLVFNSDRAGDGGSALWRVPAAGGTAERIPGTPSRFNYDPNVARRGGAIVYPGSTP